MIKGSINQEYNYKHMQTSDPKYIKQTLTEYIKNSCNSTTKDKKYPILKRITLIVLCRPDNKKRGIMPENAKN